MRDIRFRGKRLDTGEWVYGYYTKSPKDIVYITPFRVGAPIKVDPETAGQWTGLEDIHGIEIYEGDIVEWCFGDSWYRRSVDFHNGCFGPRLNSDNVLVINLGYKVVGNIHDDPELLDS